MLRMVIPFTQPMDGKATIVIEDAQGNGVRNLVADLPFPKKTHEVEWDGLDDAGNPAQPGNYRWRSIHHPGITPEYQFSFCNDGTPSWRTGSGTDMWGPDHGQLTAAAAGKELTFFAGSIAESAYPIVAVDQQGIKRKHFFQAPGVGLWQTALATDDTYLLVARLHQTDRDLPEHSRHSLRGHALYRGASGWSHLPDRPE